MFIVYGITVFVSFKKEGKKLASAFLFISWIYMTWCVFLYDDQMLDQQCFSSNVPHSQTGLIINSLFVVIINSCVSVWIIIISADKHQNHGFLSISFTCEDQYAIDD